MASVTDLHALNGDVYAAPGWGIVALPSYEPTPESSQEDIPQLFKDKISLLFSSEILTEEDKKVKMHLAISGSALIVALLVTVIGLCLLNPITAGLGFGLLLGAGIYFLVILIMHVARSQTAPEKQLDKGFSEKEMQLFGQLIAQHNSETFADGTTVVEYIQELVKTNGFSEKELAFLSKFIVCSNPEDTGEIDSPDAAGLDQESQEPLPFSPSEVW